MNYIDVFRSGPSWVMVLHRFALCKVAALAMFCVLLSPTAFAENYKLVIGETEIKLSDGPVTAMTINGSMPAPTLYFKEGEELVIEVTNTLDEISSVHWHGLILPYTQDGAPGFSYNGIQPGETFTYRFPAKQAGTYWYHSHSAMQEQRGMYGAIIIEPKKQAQIKQDREYAVVFSDWHDTQPSRVLSNLKRRPDFYNFHQETLLDLFDRKEEQSFSEAVADRMAWSKVRMMKTDVADVSGYRFLINGMDPEQNWTALYKPGERVRLRLVNASAMSFMDVYIPGLQMTVVQADGNDIEPITVDELRIAVAETYDVIVQPQENRAYTLMAEPMARTGYARATLAPRAGMSAKLPPLRSRPQLTMMDMAGHGGHEAMNHKAMNHKAMNHEAMNHEAMNHEAMPQEGGKHQAQAHMGHSSMGKAEGKEPFTQDAFYKPGSGLIPSAYNGGKFLSYSDLKAVQSVYATRPVDREVLVRLTGNMERYSWSINGETFDEAAPFRFREGERIRLKFVNETMMTHPMHLHGMWMILDNGQGDKRPAKHVIQVAPGMTVTAEVEIDATGQWPFHCHLLYHMHAGMMRKVIVEAASTKTLPQPMPHASALPAAHHMHQQGGEDK